MKESEYAENNVNARDIIANVLSALGMNAPAFSKATGISYMRIFDLQRGRTKKFNPGVVNVICETFPQINKNYLYTGEGSVLTSDVPADIMSNPLSNADNAAALRELMELQRTLIEKQNELGKREQELNAREIELMKRELALTQRENGYN